MDSGAVHHITGDINDFVEYEPVYNHFVQTANKGAHFPIRGIETVILMHDIWDPSDPSRAHNKVIATRLHPVLHMPNLHT